MSLNFFRIDILSAFFIKKPIFLFFVLSLTMWSRVDKSNSIALRSPALFLSWMACSKIRRMRMKLECTYWNEFRILIKFSFMLIAPLTDSLNCLITTMCSYKMIWIKTICMFMERYTSFIIDLLIGRFCKQYLKFW